MLASDDDERIGRQRCRMPKKKQEPIASLCITSIHRGRALHHRPGGAAAAAARSRDCIWCLFGMRAPGTRDISSADTKQNFLSYCISSSSKEPNQGGYCALSRAHHQQQFQSHTGIPSLDEQERETKRHEY